MASAYNIVVCGAILLVLYLLQTVSKSVLLIIAESLTFFSVMVSFVLVFAPKVALGGVGTKLNVAAMLGASIQAGMATRFDQQTLALASREQAVVRREQALMLSESRNTRMSAKHAEETLFLAAAERRLAEAGAQHCCVPRERRRHARPEDRPRGGVADVQVACLGRGGGRLRAVPHAGGRVRGSRSRELIYGKTQGGRCCGLRDGVDGFDGDAAPPIRC
jgi:hypothetical protein